MHSDDEGLHAMSEVLMSQSSVQATALSALRGQLDSELQIARQHEEKRARAKLEGDTAMRKARLSLASGDIQVNLDAHVAAVQQQMRSVMRAIRTPTTTASRF